MNWLAIGLGIVCSLPVACIVTGHALIAFARRRYQRAQLAKLSRRAGPFR